MVTSEWFTTGVELGFAVISGMAEDVITGAAVGLSEPAGLLVFGGSLSCGFPDSSGDMLCAGLCEPDGFPLSVGSVVPAGFTLSVGSVVPAGFTLSEGFDEADGSRLACVPGVWLSFGISVSSGDTLGNGNIGGCGFAVAEAVPATTFTLQTYFFP